MRRSPTAPRAISVTAALALIAGLLVASPIPAAQAADRPPPWSAACSPSWAAPATGSRTAPTTELAQDPSGTTYSTDVHGPGRDRWEYKVALNDSWDESYGPDGGATPTARCVLAGAAKLVVDLRRHDPPDDRHPDGPRRRPEVTAADRRWPPTACATG